MKAPGEFTEKVVEIVVGMPGPLVVPLKLLPRPANCPLRPNIEAFGIEQHALIVVPQNDLLASLSDDRQALTRVGAVTDHIAEAVDRVNLLLVDVSEDGVQRLKVAVDITDDGEFHGCFPVAGSALSGWLGRDPRLGTR